MPPLPVTIRPAVADDAPGIERILGALHTGGMIAVERELQTGSFYLVAVCGDEVCGALRTSEDEGVGSMDRLVSVRPGAGRLLVRAAERRAQDRGLRWLRARVPEGRVSDWFRWLGYLPVSREDGPHLIVEKRLPLLTVREQRREDAEAISEIAGLDPWPFTQGHRAGWFVLADGQRVVGVVSVRDAGMGQALVDPPVLREGYAGRGLELWMVERAATDSATRGAHTASLPATPAIRALERDLEDRRWFLDGDMYRKRLEDTPLVLEPFD